LLDEKKSGLSGQRMNQDRQELREFIDLLREEGVRSYLEIGCRWGDTLHAVGMALIEGSRVVGVDLPGIKTGGIRYRLQGSEPYLERAVRMLNDSGRDARLVIGDSRAAVTIEAARALGPFDAVLIDGDHTPNGVRADWENYGPMARIVALHDIRNDHQKWGVRRFWEKISAGRARREIALHPARRGIGVLWN
jgi:hypothetical protein